MSTWDEQLYRGAIQETKGRLADPTPFNIVRTAGEVRRLLLDGANSLVDRVNRTRRIQFLFRAMKPERPPVTDGLVLQLRNPHVDPTFPTSSSDYYKRDQFLALKYLEYRDQFFSVRELVLFCAHVLGGIHRGDPGTPEEKLLAELDDALTFPNTDGTAPSLVIVKAIVEVTLEGLDPLTRAIG
jgi:hypothetical protein